MNILVRDEAGRTLLQFRDSAATIFPLLWGFWGGAMAPEDTSPAHCAARELLEELELDATPSDFRLVGVRRSTKGEAQLLEFRRPIAWGSFTVREGAGAAFLWRHEIEALPLSAPVAEHLATDPMLFGSRPGH